MKVENEIEIKLLPNRYLAYFYYSQAERLSLENSIASRFNTLIKDAGRTERCERHRWTWFIVSRSLPYTASKDMLEKSSIIDESRPIIRFQAWLRFTQRSNDTYIRRAFKKKFNTSRDVYRKCFGTFIRLPSFLLMRIIERYTGSFYTPSGMLINRRLIH